jgi:holliday junction DNA helicase RuvB
VAIGAALSRGEPLPHVLLTSNGGGLGKTSFARILAEEMYSPLVQTSGPCMTSLVDLRKALITLKPGTLFHIDEIHAMSRTVADELLLVLEEHVINVSLADGAVRLPLPPFTLIGSTTLPSRISGPLMRRFGLHFHFDFYSVPELTAIVWRMSECLDVTFEPGVCTGIAERGLGIPRICLRHAERVRDVAHACSLRLATRRELEVAMQMEGVDQLGLAGQHRLILQRLADARPRGLSSRSLALQSCLDWRGR